MQSTYQCPICLGRKLTLRYEAGYVYSYVVDSDAPGLKNHEEFLSFLYDKREQKDTRTYIECSQCGTQYPYTFLNGVLEERYNQEEHHNQEDHFHQEEQYQKKHTVMR